MSIATPALPSGQAPASLYFDADYQPAAAAAAVYEQRAPLRHDAARQAWHWQLHFAQPPGKLHMDAWLRDADVASPRYAYQRSVYFADGRLALLEERNGDGDFDGVNVEYHANGAVKSRKAYREGEYEGLHSHYHANGQLSREMRYQAGQPADGEYLSFDEHGQISNRAHFADGVLSGEAQAFHPNGGRIWKASAMACTRPGGRTAAKSRASISCMASHRAGRCCISQMANWTRKTCSRMASC